jgi:hypothetical protein
MTPFLQAFGSCSKSSKLVGVKVYIVSSAIQVALGIYGTFRKAGDRQIEDQQ